MKRNLLAVIIPALLVAGTASANIEVFNKDGHKVDFFGKVKAMNYITKTGNKDGDHSKVSFGFNGYTTISDSLAGYGKFEYELKSFDKGGEGDSETKYAYAGLDFGNAGQFDYGRNDGVLKAITAYTDVLPEFGGDASDSDSKLYVLSNRSTAVATYRNNNFFGAVEGLSFALQYADKDGAEKGAQSIDREAYGLNAQYSILDTGFSIGAGYATTSKSKLYFGGDNAKRAKSYIIGGNYDANNLYVGAIYAASKNNNSYKGKGWEMVVQYGIDLDVGRITPSLAYVQHKTKANEAGDYQNKHKYVDVGFSYDFNKNLSAIVDYKINLLKEKDGVTNAETKDTLALGLVYKF